MKMKPKEEVERRQPEKEESRECNKYGDGAQWLRGPVIGRGSFGSVYLAKLKEPEPCYSYLPPVLAVKSAEVSVSGSLQKEKEVLDYLQGCRYVLQCWGEEITTSYNGGMIYNLLLEYASRGDLASVIKKSNGRGLPEYDIKWYTRSILRGLKHVHDSGYIHCDLKPENILLVPTSNSKLGAVIGDFGLAKRVKKMDPYLRGSSFYLSPEVVTNNVHEPPSDIWALGCVVLQMLTGMFAWDNEGDSGREDMFCRLVNEGALPKILDEISEEAKSFLKGCLEWEAKSRLTAEMLLNHPFLAGLEEDIEEEFEEVVHDNSELSDSFSSDDSSYFSEEESSCSSGENVFRNIPLFSSSNHKAAAMGVMHLTAIPSVPAGA